MTARLDPEVTCAVMRAAGLEPLEPYRGIHVKWLCRCLKCGSQVTPKYVHVRSGHGCGVCGSRKSAEAARRRVDPVAAALFMVQHGFQPLEPYPGSDRPWRCQCLTCGTNAAPCYVYVKSRGGGGCRTCKYVTQAEKQKIPEAVAAAEMLAAGMEPVGPFRGTNHPWLGRCLACGESISPRLISVRNGQGVCRYCAKCTVRPSSAVACMRGSGLEPLVEYPGSGVPWRCRCLKCDRVVTPRYSMVKSGQGGCIGCAPWGFDPRKPAVVYLIVNPVLGAVKIGIGAAEGRRLVAHRGLGWEVISEVRVPGHLAKQVEKGVLDWWRTDLGLPPYLGKEEMPQGGWTETVDASEVDVAGTIRRISRLALVGLAA